MSQPAAPRSIIVYLLVVFACVQLATMFPTTHKGTTRSLPLLQNDGPLRCSLSLRMNLPPSLGMYKGTRVVRIHTKQPPLFVRRVKRRVNEGSKGEVMNKGTRAWASLCECVCGTWAFIHFTMYVEGHATESGFHSPWISFTTSQVLTLSSLFGAKCADITLH